MMPGDVPCNKPCATRWCIYNQFGVCTDNATCEDRTGDAEEGGRGMSGKIRNPERRCKICGNKCEKQMRYCKLCAREVKEIRERAAREAV